MRLIDVDALKQQFEIWDEDDEVAVWSIMNEVNSAPTIEPKPHWIPVTERLPEGDTDILVTYVDGEEARIIPVNYGRGTWFDCIFDRALDSLKVTAWMPLPKPWKEEGD